MSGRRWAAVTVTIALAMTGCGGGSSSNGSRERLGPDPPLRTDAIPEPGPRTPSVEKAVGTGLGADITGVGAMHGRGGTGAGQVMGVIDSGATRADRDPAAPFVAWNADLAGRFASMEGMGRCAMSDARRTCQGGFITSFDGDAVTGGWGGLHDGRDDGHGTNVNGIVAALKNSVGMHGVAYDARIASYSTTPSVEPPWGTGGREPHEWSPLFDFEVARGFDRMRTDNVFVVNLSWERTGPWSAQYADQLEPVIGRIFTGSESMAAFRRYSGAGGVAVWATGNDGAENPVIEAILPSYYEGLERGWLAVTAVAPNGVLANYANACGIAGDWCLAAPGSVITTDAGGGYAVNSGTSFAAPYVAAGLAALKSLFPSKSYQELRARILTTAKSSGIYGRRDLYGHGLLDLDAASRPIGGTRLALGSSDSGPMMSTAGTSVSLPQGAIDRYLAGNSLLVFDGFQSAPFEVGWEAFASVRRPYLSMDDLALAPEDRGRSRPVHGAALAFRHGVDVVKELAEAGGAALTTRRYRMSEGAVGVALGFAGDASAWRLSAAAGGADADSPGIGISGWNPEAVLSASFVPGSGDDAFGASFASGFARPMGWSGSGALALDGDAVEFAWRRTVASGETFRVDFTSRLTHLAAQGGPLLRFDDALLTSVGLGGSFNPTRDFTLAAEFGLERPASRVAGRLRAARSVDENGRIAFRDVEIDGGDLLSADRAGLRIVHRTGPTSSVGLGVVAVRDGFGRTEVLSGVKARLGF